MSVIIIHALWWLFGFVCGAAVMGTLALPRVISRTEVALAPMWTAEYYEPPPPTVIIQDDPQTLAKLAEAQNANRFYQELYRDEMDRAKMK